MVFLGDLEYYLHARKRCGYLPLAGSQNLWKTALDNSYFFSRHARLPAAIPVANTRFAMQERSAPKRSMTTERSCLSFVVPISISVTTE